MAKRDLARTVGEGGRARFGKAMGRISNGVARARTRNWLAQVEIDDDRAIDNDAVDERACGPRPRPRAERWSYQLIPPFQN